MARDYKTEEVKHFGKLTVINSRKRTPYHTVERSEIRINNSIFNKVTGYYTWINRPRQRFDYDCSMHDAYRNMLDTLDWNRYEDLKDDLEALKNYTKY